MPRAAPRSATLATSRSSCTHARAALVALGTVACLGLGLAAPARADGAETPLALLVMDPPRISLDTTALGRATHSLRLVLTNQSAATVQLTPLTLRFRPIREGVAFACDEPTARDDRWPSSLGAGASFTLARDVACETPLPGRYDVEMRGRPRGAPLSSERIYGSFSLQIEPGANPPVKLPWERSLHAAVFGTKDMPPSKDPGAARVVIALVNGTRDAVKLAPLRASLRVTRRGSTVALCAERSVDLSFAGSLAPGRTRALSTALGCPLSADGIYDVDVSIANGEGAQVHVAKNAIRVGVVLPPPPPGAPDVEPGRVIRGT